MADQGLEGQEAVAPAAAPDTSAELENSAASEPVAGVTPQAVVRSGCLLPFFKVTYPIFLNGKAETFDVRKTFAAKVNGKVTISGVGGSYGCFVLKITP